MSLVGMMDETCVILRGVVTQNENGDTERTFSPLYSGVPTSVQQKSPANRRTEDGGFVQVDRWLGFFLPQTDIQLGDRVVTDKGGQYNVEALDLVRYDHWEADLRPVAAS